MKNLTTEQRDFLKKDIEKAANENNITVIGSLDLISQYRFNIVVEIHSDINRTILLTCEWES